MSDSYYKDKDPQETQDWIDSLEGLIKAEGRAKADFLLRELTHHARSLGVNTSPGVISPYANTLDAKDDTVSVQVTKVWQHPAVFGQHGLRQHH